MPAKRAVLSALTAHELRDAADLYGLDGFDRRIKAALVDALSGSRKARIQDVLLTLKRDRLKDLCQQFDLSDRGMRKADIVARLAARERGQKSPPKRTSPPPARGNPQSTAAPGYEAELWAAANALRGSVDAAEYKHVALGLVFLKYISDAFEERRAAVLAEWGAAEADDRDAYTAANIFWVPKKARWDGLREQARQPEIGRLVDDAMVAIERDNPALKDVLPKNFGRQELDKTRLGQLIDLVGNIRVGDADARSTDVFGRVYEYFLRQFASAEGKKGGEFYTPRCIVKLLVEMLAPYRGRVYDPCCGSSGMFVQSMAFLRAHASGNGNGGRARGDISIYGQESNYTTWRLAKMNLAIRGIEGQIAHGDSFHNDRHPDLKADFILANPPFNVSDWSGERLTEDKRWRYGVPPKGNANFAWVQHMVHHLAPNGIAGFVLANGSMSSSQSGESAIRKNLIEADLVDCIVALPGQLFYSTQIPACLWFLARGSRRQRRGEVLFIDARGMGRMVDRTHRELTDEDIARIADTYRAWRDGTEAYVDVPGYCNSTLLDEVRRYGHVLAPGRYVGVAPQSKDEEPFEAKMRRLVAELHAQKAEGVRLDATIAGNLKALGFRPNAQWLAYADARINTSHDYDGEKAKKCLALVPDFVDDAIGLYQTMSGTTWE